MPNDAVFTFDPVDQAMINVAANEGILIPTETMIACRYIGFPFAVACALLEKETGGGRNVFGGDDSIWKGHHNLRVTQDAYYHFAIERDATGKSQGVGPLQLTYPPLQKQADAIGGCWVPLCNVLAGLDFLKGLRKEGLEWDMVFPIWNGNPEYTLDMVNNRIPKWKEVLSH